MGFFYLGLLLGWFLVLLVIARGIAWLIDVKHKKLVAMVIIMLGLPLPLADEIIGAIQFGELCKNQVLYKSPDMENMKGSRIISMPHADIPINDKALPMTRQIREYVSESNHALMLRYNVFRAGKGYLARTFPLNEGEAPLTFVGVCHPEEYRMLFTNYIVVN
ncbi:hypothetical protein [Massilia genomosp. 1]|uniref:Uncharacterized protein n=1 Tax=Massilia genomosp. 1 TaxID=2609280 RepID=A0ABX0N1L3_9BURK|nr:hypothetical protein [Massilia genomosp. 1]NHZ66895.1 hypothetical protein [Massilia genomosp. 1]